MRAPHGCVSTLWTLSLVVVACDQVEVSAAGATTHLSDNEIDFAAYEAVQNDNIGRALEIFGELVARDGDDAFAAMWIGMLAIRRNNLQLAESAFSRAVSKIESRMWVGDANEGYALGAKRAGLELSLQRVRERLAAQEAKSAYATNQANSADGDAHAEFVKVASIRRVHHRELGQAEFEAQHAKAAIPVIVTGFESLADDDAPLWSDLEHLRAKCGHLVPRVVQHDPSSATWAGCESGARSYDLWVSCPLPATTPFPCLSPTQRSHDRSHDRTPSVQHAPRQPAARDVCRVSRWAAGCAKRQRSRSCLRLGIARRGRVSRAAGKLSRPVLLYQHDRRWL